MLYGNYLYRNKRQEFLRRLIEWIRPASEKISDKSMEEQSQSWAAPMAGEPAEWFARFCRFRDLGAERSIQKVYDSEPRGKGRKKRNSGKPSGRWDYIVKKFHWHGRVEEMERARGAAALVEAEDWLKRERDAQHRILGGIQELQLGLLSDDGEARSKVLAKLGSISDMQGLFELGNELFKTIHGMPKGEEAARTPVDLPVPVIYFPETLQRPRLARAIEVEAEKV
jgi:hypothetical protein